MAKLNGKLKRMIAQRIRKYKAIKFPGKGSGNKLAEALSISPQLLSQWVNGSRTPSSLQLQAMSKLFDITIQELCGLKEVQKNNSKAPAFDLIMDMTYIQKFTQSLIIKRKKVNHGIKNIKALILNELDSLL